ncbi:hypothetical protein RhiTH_010022 [Rhizoctonia solani]
MSAFTSDSRYHAARTLSASLIGMGHLLKADVWLGSAGHEELHRQVGSDPEDGILIQSLTLTGDRLRLDIGILLQHTEHGRPERRRALRKLIRNCRDNSPDVPALIRRTRAEEARTKCLPAVPAED